MAGEPGKRNMDITRDIDTRIGHNIRIRRIAMRMSQKELADRLELTFQQIQKYEKGSNRIAFSRAFQIAQILECETSDFLEGVKGVEAFPSNPAFSSQTARAMQLYESLPPEFKKTMLAVLKALSSVAKGESEENGG